MIPQRRGGRGGKTKPSDPITAATCDGWTLLSLHAALKLIWQLEKIQSKVADTAEALASTHIPGTDGPFEPFQAGQLSLAVFTTSNVRFAHNFW